MLRKKLLPARLLGAGVFAMMVLAALVLWKWAYAQQTDPVASTFAGVNSEIAVDLSDSLTESRVDSVRVVASDDQLTMHFDAKVDGLNADGSPRREPIMVNLTLTSDLSVERQIVGGEREKVQPVRSIEGERALDVYEVELPIAGSGWFFMHDNADAVDSDYGSIFLTLADGDMTSSNLSSLSASLPSISATPSTVDLYYGPSIDAGRVGVLSASPEIDSNGTRTLDWGPVEQRLIAPTVLAMKVNRWPFSLAPWVDTIVTAGAGIGIAAFWRSPASIVVGVWLSQTLAAAWRLIARRE